MLTVRRGCSFPDLISLFPQELHHAQDCQLLFLVLQISFLKPRHGLETAFAVSCKILAGFGEL